jgi:putative ABC transport system permease protein
VLPGREPRGPTDIAQIFSDSLKEKDLAALQRHENVPTLQRIMPVVFGGESALYQEETYRLTVFGGTELIAEIFDLVPAEGSFFTEEEVKERASVAVIGAEVKEELFGDSDAVGEKIRIKNRNFRVAGVLPRKGQTSFFNFDEIAFIPYTTAQEYIFGIKYFHRFILQASSQEAIPETVRDVEATLRASHDITDPEKDDFHAETPADLAARLGVITGALTAFLASVVGISLLVGGVGIMNIMLVSVTERTREVGLRKAVGATNRDILRQFLFEAVILTALGGVIGILLGGLLSFIAALVLSRTVATSWAFSFPFSAALLGFGVSALVGLVFGLYPARRAAKLDPVEALRYE